MTAHFYLFDVEDGQCAALKLPNEEWCIFDVGCSAVFSPIKWIAEKRSFNSAFNTLLRSSYFNQFSNFSFLKATISHHHGDHLRDSYSLFRYRPRFITTVATNSKYDNDIIESNTQNSLSAVMYFIQENIRLPMTYYTPDYGFARITEKSLPLAIAQSLGSTANSRVNNASIVSRIDIYGNSILLCGDLEKSAWDFVTNSNSEWFRFLSNIDILVSPHHGHNSGYHARLLEIAKPSVVLTSVKSRDPHVAQGYSGDMIKGIRLDGILHKNITTRQKGHIHLEIVPPGIFNTGGELKWTFGDNALVSYL